MILYVFVNVESIKFVAFTAIANILSFHLNFAFAAVGYILLCFGLKRERSHRSSMVSVDSLFVDIVLWFSRGNESFFP